MHFDRANCDFNLDKPFLAKLYKQIYSSVKPHLKIVTFIFLSNSETHGNCQQLPTSKSVVLSSVKLSPVNLLNIPYKIALPLLPTQYSILQMLLFLWKRYILIFISVSHLSIADLSLHLHSITSYTTPPPRFANTYFYHHHHTVSFGQHSFINIKR